MGWEKFKDAALQCIKLPQGGKMSQEVSNVTGASQVITPSGL